MLDQETEVIAVSGVNGKEARPRIAVLIPCFNEQVTIGSVIHKFKRELPDAAIHVFDNNSTDLTAEVAMSEGAVVTKEKKRGKGNVVSAMFKKVDADVYVLVDGDDTYAAEKVHDLIKPVIDNEADMVVAARRSPAPEKAYPRFHVLGNYLVRKLIQWIFKARLRDVMSGYRALSKDLVNSLPLLSTGFEVETELTLQTLNRNFVVKEIDAPYKERPSGSYSKLRTFSDGFRVLHTIFYIFKDFKPLTFFGGIGFILLALSAVLGVIVLREYVLYRYIYKVPTAILSVGLGISGLLTIFMGTILTTVNFRFKELYAILNRGKFLNHD